MNQMIFVPTILFLVIVAPIWLVLHYTFKGKMAKGISPEERENLDYMLATMDKLAERVETLESILSEEHSDWRKADKSSSRGSRSSGSQSRSDTRGENIDG